MLSEYITSLSDVSVHIVASMYVRFRYSGKNPMRFAVFFGVYLCGFAVFGPPLRPRPLVNLNDSEQHDSFA